MRLAFSMLLLTACAQPVATVQRVDRPLPLRLDVQPVWPSSGAPLQPLDVLVPHDWTPHVIAIDPGHGYPGNPGATRYDGVSEHEVTLRIGQALAQQLRSTGHHEVVLLRTGAFGPTYPQRVAEIVASGAELVISVHGDIRLEGSPSEQRGYSILYSDEHADRAADAERWARAVADRMSTAGFSAFNGTYLGQYQRSGGGVYVDRHRPGRRIYMLRRPKVPTILVETHHLLDPDEVARWDEERTVSVFAHAVHGAIIDYFVTR
ncbi:MAG: N-acetylmuramoyl-L-alanine amidase [Kiritimatiellia bacterium]|jgi:N-acetylmuramoyl-L-alanine amidase